MPLHYTTLHDITSPHLAAVEEDGLEQRRDDRELDRRQVGEEAVVEHELVYEEERDLSRRRVSREEMAAQPRSV